NNAGLPFTAPNTASVRVDTTVPATAAVTAPANASVLRAATVPSFFKGNAADNSGGVGLNSNSTTFTLKRSADAYWTGTAWQAGAFPLATSHGSTTGNASTTWTSSATL